MAKEVIKRGGVRAPFKSEKIKRSIRKACKDVHLPAARTKKVVSKVSAAVLRFARTRKTAIKTSVIRQKILAGLKKEEPTVWKAWMKYDKRRRARRKKK